MPAKLRRRERYRDDAPAAMKVKDPDTGKELFLTWGEYCTAVLTHFRWIDALTHAEEVRRQ